LASQSRGDVKDALSGPRPAISPVPGLARLWAETIGDPEIRIAILDAPVDRANPWLESAKIDQRWLGHHAHCSAHGIEVASVIFASHDTPVLGIAPGCRGVSVPIYECDPQRSPATDQRQLAAAIHEALGAGAQVINISAGQLVPTTTAEPELSDAIRASAAAGALIVAAVGNDGCDCLHVPAALPCVLAVGAMRWDGSPLPGSNWGSTYGRQGILAPGENIPVASSHGRVELRTGTSYATAIVSGIVALLLSRERKRSRPARPLLIRKALLAAARSVRQTGSDRRRFLAGRLNVTEAVHLLDTWSNTMTHDPNFDLATECSSQAESDSNGHPAGMSPSSELSAPHVKPSQVQETPAREPRHREYADAVQPSACSTCGGARQLVYALGQLSYDFGSEAGLDAFKQRMDGKNPFDETQMVSFLGEKKYKWDAAALLWTVCVESMPIYVIRPEGPFADDAYQQLRDSLGHKHAKKPEDRAERVAVPGVITGQARLFNGQQVPVINPDLRGFCDWNTGKLVEKALEALPPDLPELNEKQKADLKEKLDELVPEFLYRIYHELRNAGRTAKERALNYAGTNLVEPTKILRRMMRAKHTLDAIDAEPSALYRPGSDCWDITLAFFDPAQAMQTVRWMHRFTVDVSEVIPVTVGETRSWKAR
jgi:cyanobactin maturation PatA/PatG family protease